MEDIKIPIDKQLVEFRNHILANPRTFLSSKFGDGKSYFLNELKQKYKDEFVFITIYPVNYQVASNEDIFKLIKRDVLFQLMAKDMISDEVEISNELALWGFIQNNFRSFLSDLLPYVAQVALPNELLPLVMSALKGKKIFTDLKKKFEEYKKKLNERETLLEEFVSHVDNSLIYEEDIVTTIIKQSIIEYKKLNGHKNVVLVVEDLDRLDPAHLFRLLNIFSAHIDYGYKLLAKPDSALMVSNKFGFDNVVFVAHFNNIRKIFKHFYGEQTDFNGYIGKFLSSAPYEFSIREIRADYIYEYLSNSLDCPKKLISELLTSEMLDNRTTRECVQSFDIKSQIVQQPVYLSNEQPVTLDITGLKILSVLRRLNVADEEIVNTCSSLYFTDKDNFIKYVAPYMLLQKGEKQSLMVDIVINDKNLNWIQTEISVDPATGLGRKEGDYSLYSDRHQTDFRAIFELMLNYIVK